MVGISKKQGRIEPKLLLIIIIIIINPIFIPLTCLFSTMLRQNRNSSHFSFLSFYPFRTSIFLLPARLYLVSPFLVFVHLSSFPSSYPSNGRIQLRFQTYPSSDVLDFPGKGQEFLFRNSNSLTFIRKS